MRRRTCLAAIIACALMPSVEAQIVGDPAGPRLGTVYILDVLIDDPAQVQQLNDQGYNISHVTADHAEIYATLEERDQLIAEGFVVTDIGTQPSPPTFGPATRAFGTFYHSYATLTTDLLAYEAAFPSICRLVSVGTSVQGREQWAMLITNNPDTEENEPEFKYVATMHGDEPVGTEMCLLLIDRLLNDYGVDSRITTLVDTTAIWILPLMNPDGRQAGTRNNANGFDLNRSFPKFPSDFTGTTFNSNPSLAGLQPEVRNLMVWAVNNSFTLSVNFHGGAVVVSYAYDADVGIPDGAYAAAPDDALFVDLSLLYAATNPCMTSIMGTPCTLNFTAFPNGITNGNDWFIVEGGMQDWMYRYVGDFESSIELSIPKTPAAVNLPQYWADNEESMLSYIEAVHRGVRGVVTDAGSGQPVFAKITVAGNTQPVFSDPDVGDYYRLLPAGTYDLTFEALAYDPVTIMGVVVGAGSPATVLDVQLNAIAAPASSRWALYVMAGALILTACIWLRRRPRDANPFA